MAHKLKKLDHSAKRFLDPATLAGIGAFSWFVLQSAFSGFVGWTAAQFTQQIWEKFKRSRSKSDSGVSSEES